MPTTSPGKPGPAVEKSAALNSPLAKLTRERAARKARELAREHRMRELRDETAKLREQWLTAWQHLRDCFGRERQLRDANATARAILAVGQLIAALGKRDFLSKLWAAPASATDRLHRVNEFGGWAMNCGYGPRDCAALLLSAVQQVPHDVLVKQLVEAEEAGSIRDAVAWLPFFRDRLFSPVEQPDPNLSDVYLPTDADPEGGDWSVEDMRATEQLLWGNTVRDPHASPAEPHPAPFHPVGEDVAMTAPAQNPQGGQPKQNRTAKVGNPRNRFTVSQKAAHKKRLAEWRKASAKGRTMADFLQDFPVGEREKIRTQIKTAQKWASDQKKREAMNRRQ